MLDLSKKAAETFAHENNLYISGSEITSPLGVERVKGKRAADGEEDKSKRHKESVLSW